MSAAAHTPGPWTATDHGIRDSGGYLFQTVHPSRYEGQDERFALETATRAADVRLIAAAPDLLAALRPFANYACTPPCGCHNCAARAAIARATGTEVAHA